MDIFIHLPIGKRNITTDEYGRVKLPEQYSNVNLTVANKMLYGGLYLKTRKQFLDLMCVLGYTLEDLTDSKIDYRDNGSDMFNKIGLILNMSKYGVMSRNHSNGKHAYPFDRSTIINFSHDEIQSLTESDNAFIDRLFKGQDYHYYQEYRKKLEVFDHVIPTDPLPFIYKDEIIGTFDHYLSLMENLKGRPDLIQSITDQWRMAIDIHNMEREYYRIAISNTDKLNKL